MTNAMSASSFTKDIHTANEHKTQIHSREDTTYLDGLRNKEVQMSIKVYMQ